MNNKNYVIIGIKWFDRKNGNTYHRVNIIDVDSKETIFNSGVVYGYDDAYKQTAYEGLVKLGLVKSEDRFNHKLNRERFIYISYYVNTQKELKGDD